MRKVVNGTRSNEKKNCERFWLNQRLVRSAVHYAAADIERVRIDIIRQGTVTASTNTLRLSSSSGGVALSVSFFHNLPFTLILKSTISFICVELRGNK